MQRQPDIGSNRELWPELPYSAWKNTLETLHMWTQVVGKVRLALSPSINHWWHVPLYVTARGLTTSPIPYQHSLFEIDFDFIDHNLSIQTSNGTSKILPLIPQSVAEFYDMFFTSLQALGIEVKINPLPNEVPNPIRCDEDTVHAAYDPEYTNRFWRILLQTELVMQRYRSQFIGKSSPIHFFWGSFDLALSFFSGRRAPERKGADAMTREAYSHEVISCGFWPGNEQFREPAFYAYAVPVPEGLENVKIRPEAAFYHKDMGEFFLRYEDVRTSPEPEKMLYDFFQSAFEAEAKQAHWDLDHLMRHDL